MKKIALFILLIFSIASNAQKDIQTYFGLSQSTGYSLGFSKLETGGGTGYETKRKSFKGWRLPKKKLPISIGLQAEGGIIIKERLMIGTGIKYLFRQQEGVYYCAVCDLWVTSSTNLNASFLEIPLRFQLNMVEEKNTFPIVSSEIYWSKSFGLIEKVNFLGCKLGVGVARKIGKHLLTIESQFNQSIVDKDEYPNYYLSEIQLNLRWAVNLF